VLLVAEAEAKASEDEKESEPENAPAAFTEAVDEPDTEVITLFISAESDVSLIECSQAPRVSEPGKHIATLQASDPIVQQDSIPIDMPTEALLAISTPYIHLLLRPEVVAAGATRVQKRSMRDFVGMEKADEATKKALTDFSYYMATGTAYTIPFMHCVAISTRGSHLQATWTKRTKQ
jgi:hypothetical protein